MKQPKPYLLNVLNGIAAIQGYTPSSEEKFLADPKTQDAVLMRLQDIGENLIRVRDLFPDFWESHAIDSWIKAIGLRNYISHGYRDIDMTTVWTLITKDLREFMASIEALL